MNAYYLLNEGGASAFLKDGEYFYNAIEWILVVNQHINISATTETKNKNELTNSQLFSPINDLQHDFASSKSHTTMSINSLSLVNFKSQINYKTWYGIPNPYHQVYDLAVSKCEHVSYKNYSIDHNSSTYTPAIFTPRIAQPQRSSRKRPGPFLQDSMNFSYDENAEALYKLIDKLQEKMTSNSTVNSAPVSALKPSRLSARSTNRKIQITPQQHTNNNNNNNSPIFLTSAQSVPSSSQSHVKPRDKRLLQQFILKQQEGIFLPDISNTPKILSLFPRSRSTVKDELHNIYEYYTGTNAFINNSQQQQQPNNDSNLISSLSLANSSVVHRGSRQEQTSNQNRNNSISNKKPNKSIIQKLGNDINSNKSKEVTFK
jgi:hypothetical protein